GPGQESCSEEDRGQESPGQEGCSEENRCQEGPGQEGCSEEDRGQEDDRGEEGAGQESCNQEGCSQKACCQEGFRQEARSQEACPCTVHRGGSGRQNGPQPRGGLALPYGQPPVSEPSERLALRCRPVQVQAWTGFLH